MRLSFWHRREEGRMAMPTGKTVWVLSILLLSGLFISNQAIALATPLPVADLSGADITGGAAHIFGKIQAGMRANYIYAAPNKDASVMEASFVLPAQYRESLSLHLLARRDDKDSECPVRISLNGQTILEGSRLFRADAWSWMLIPLPPDAMVSGVNRLRFENLSPQGDLGNVPWFMVARAVIAPANWKDTPGSNLIRDFHIKLPRAMQPLPHPLHRGEVPGFKIRGTKGWMWSVEQYLSEIPVLVKYKMNFLMNCYGSLADIEHYPWGSPDCNRWWEPLPEEKKAGYTKIIQACKAQKITFCFSMNPNISTRRILDYAKSTDVELLWQHYEWAQSQGVQWFNLQFDDITAGTDPAGQARMTNEFLHRLRLKNPAAQMIFCPTIYWGDGTSEADKTYLQVLARELHPDVYIFWTGDGVVGRISREAAESYRKVVAHRLIIWDNYPVNDGQQTLHLGPVMFRDPDLGEVCDGYMSNPLFPQNEINRVPLLTMADYAWNPQAYDPARSIGQAIWHLSRNQAEREALRELVELYPGMLLYGQGTGYNPVKARFETITQTPHSRSVAQGYLMMLKSVQTKLKAACGTRYQDAQKLLSEDISTIEANYQSFYE